MEKFHNDTVWSISPANCTEGFNCTDFTDGLNGLIRNETCTNDYCETDDDYIDRIEAYIFPSVYEWILIGLHCMVFIVGLVGNFLVCLAVYRNHTMRTVTNMFIVNLAIADFLVIFLCLPPTVLWDITETWFMGSTLCKIIPYFQVNKINNNGPYHVDKLEKESKSIRLWSLHTICRVEQTHSSAVFLDGWPHFNSS